MRGGSPLRTKSPPRIKHVESVPRFGADFQIVQDISITSLSGQNKDIEIERLQTTCAALNQRVFGGELQMQQLEAYKSQLAENEAVRAQQADEI